MNDRLGCSIIVRITEGTARDPVIKSQTARDMIIRPVEFRNDLSLKHTSSLASLLESPDTVSLSALKNQVWSPYLIFLSIMDN